MTPIFTPIILASLLILRPLSSLYPLLFERSSEISVPFHNDELTGARFWILFFYFILSSLARRLGLVTPLKEIDIAVRMPFRVQHKDVDLYRIACGATCAPEELLEIPAHLQLLLSALTEPAMLVLLAKRGCPIDPIGAVNVRNRFELPDPSACAAALKAPSGLYITAKMSQEVVKVKRGSEYSIVVELNGKDKEGVFYRQTFTMLQFAQHRNPPPPIVHADSPVTTSVSQIRVETDDPALWAQLSKDYNPIHMSSIAARLLGFKTKIAHGNHVASKAIQSVLRAEKEDADGIRQGGRGDRRGFSGNGIMEVQFKRPSFVPCTLEVKQATTLTGGESYLEVVSKDKVLSTIRYSR
ncbi:hypothetical protein IAT40_002549 [Kwoniella sp. CBS 6097]